MTWAGLRWAFTTGSNSNWHPVTWLSHMLDCTVFGISPTGPHLVNLALHIANSAGIFALLRRSTKSAWSSALVAALFAVHPAHVESVAWISERKDVLSTFIWLLTTAAYLKWIESRRLGWQLCMVVLFALGLMTKPMLVTLPVTLLLFDVWPLSRLTWKDWLRPQTLLPFVWEKAHLLVLATVSSIVTIMVQRDAMPPAGALPMLSRLVNACMAIACYVGMFVWPSDLCIMYPLRLDWRVWQVGGALALLIIVSVIVLRESGRRPWLLFGWAFFLLTLMPVIGIVQVGRQAMADRYTYVSFVGLSIAVAWTLRELVLKYSSARAVVLGTCAVVLVVAAVNTQVQAAVWCNEEDLLRQAVRHSPWFPWGHERLGSVLLKRGQNVEAEGELRAALRTGSRGPETLHGLGLALSRTGRNEEAVRMFRESLNIKLDVHVRGNLGVALAQLGRTREAIFELREVVRTESPPNPKTHRNLATALASDRQVEEAALEYTVAMALGEDDGAVLNDWGNMLARNNDVRGAIGKYKEGLSRHPNNCGLYLSLGIALRTEGQTEESVLELTRSVDCDAESVDGRLNLAISLAQQARVNHAIAQLQAVGQIAERYARSGRLGHAIAASRRAEGVAHEIGLHEVAHELSMLRRSYSHPATGREFGAP